MRSSRRRARRRLRRHLSHDRFFLDRLCTHILAAEGEGQWTWFEGNFAEYEADRIRRQGDAPPKPIKYASLVEA